MLMGKIGVCGSNDCLSADRCGDVCKGWGDWKGLSATVSVRSSQGLVVRSQQGLACNLESLQRQGARWPRILGRGSL